MTDENDLKVAEQLGEIRATLRNMEKTLSEINRTHGAYGVRLDQIERDIIAFKARGAVIAAVISAVVALTGWMISHADNLF